MQDWLGKLVDPYHPTELRALKVRHGNRTVTMSGFFDREHIDLMAREAARLGEHAGGVYFTLNPLRQEMQAKRSNRVDVAGSGDLTGDGHVVRRHLLLIDADPVRLSGISSTDAEKALALETLDAVREYLRGQGFPDPVECDSGNGWHLLYKVDLPADDGGLTQRFLRAIDAMFSTLDVAIDTSVYNPSRICKLYGTPSRKGDHTDDRPHRLSSVVKMPSTFDIVPKHLLEAVAARAPVLDNCPARATRTTGSQFDLDDWVRRFLNVHSSAEYKGGRKIVLEECPFNSEHKAPDSALFVRDSGAIGFRCLHNSCMGKTWQDVRQLFEPDAYSFHFTDGDVAHGQAVAEVLLSRDKSPVVSQYTVQPGSAPVSAVSPPRTFRQLHQAHPELRQPVVTGLLRVGETMNIIAPPKLGKSWLGTGLALCQVTGKRWLDSYRTWPGNVLILDNELHPETSASRIPRVADALGIGLDEYADGLFVENLRGQQMDVFAFDRYFDQFKPGEFRLVIVDAFYRCLPQGMSENDNGNMTTIYNTFDHYASKLNCAFVLIHHTSKGNQSSKSVTDVGAGAGAQSRAVDTHLVLRAHAEEGIVVLEAATRSWAPVEPVCLRWEWPLWSLACEYDPSELKVEKPRGGKAGEAKAERLQTLCEDCVDFLVAEGKQTKNAIRNHLGCNSAKVAEVIETLLSQGRIGNCQVGIYAGYEAHVSEGRTGRTDSF